MRDRLLRQLDAILHNDSRSDAEFMTFISDLMGYMNQSSPFFVSSDTGRRQFRAAAQQMVRMVYIPEGDVELALCRLTDLMALQDMYIMQDPDFTLAQQNYFKSVLDQSVREETQHLVQQLQNLRSRIDPLEELLQQKEQTIIQLRQELADKPDPCNSRAVDLEKQAQRITELNNALSDARKENEALKKEMNQANSLITELNDALSDARKENETLKKENVRRKMEMTQVDRRIIEMKNLSLSSQEVDEMVKRLSEESKASPKPPEPLEKIDLYYLDWEKGTIRSDDMEPAFLSNLSDELRVNVQILAVMGEDSKNQHVIGFFPRLFHVIFLENVHFVDWPNLKGCPMLQQITFDNKNCVIQIPPARLVNATIQACPGGTVEKYAVKNNLQFNILT